MSQKQFMKRLAREIRACATWWVFRPRSWCSGVDTFRNVGLKRSISVSCFDASRASSLDLNRASTSETMKHLLRVSRFLDPYRWRVVAALVCLILTNATNLFFPQFFRLIIDDGITPHNGSVIL